LESIGLPPQPIDCNGTYPNGSPVGSSLCVGACDTVPVACCKDGSCIGDSTGNSPLGMISENVCKYIFGGTPVQSQVCGTVDCCDSLDHYGACCWYNETCSETLYTQCNGTFMGPNTTCDGENAVNCCFDSVGACCYGNDCEYPRYEQDCSGTWFDSMTCEQVSIYEECTTPPPDAIGCCCVANGISYTSIQSDCTGTWIEGYVCGNPEPLIGSCCFCAHDGDGNYTPTCMITSDVYCSEYGGTFKANSSCWYNNSEDTIPEGEEDNWQSCDCDVCPSIVDCDPGSYDEDDEPEDGWGGAGCPQGGGDCFEIGDLPPPGTIYFHNMTCDDVDCNNPPGPPAGGDDVDGRVTTLFIVNDAGAEAEATSCRACSRGPQQSCWVCQPHDTKIAESSSPSGCGCSPVTECDRGIDGELICGDAEEHGGDCGSCPCCDSGETSTTPLPPPPPIPPPPPAQTTPTKCCVADPRDCSCQSPGYSGTGLCNGGRVPQDLSNLCPNTHPFHCEGSGCPDCCGPGSIPLISPMP